MLVEYCSKYGSMPDPFPLTSLADLADGVTFPLVYIDKLTLKFKNLSQLIDDNYFIWILSFDDEIVCHTLSNLLILYLKNTQNNSRMYSNNKNKDFNNR
jgi:hypothetical protein